MEIFRESGYFLNQLAIFGSFGDDFSSAQSTRGGTVQGTQRSSSPAPPCADIPNRRARQQPTAANCHDDAMTDSCTPPRPRLRKELARRRGQPFSQLAAAQLGPLGATRQDHWQPTGLQGEQVLQRLGIFLRSQRLVHSTSLFARPGVSLGTCSGHGFVTFCIIAEDTCCLGCRLLIVLRPSDSEPLGLQALEFLSCRDLSPSGS